MGSRGGKLRYPKPYKKKGRPASLYFVYTDPLTGKRRYQATGSPKVGESVEYIKNFMDRLTPAGTTTFRSYAAQFFSPETNPRYIRYQMAGRPYGLLHITQLKSLITRYVFPERFSDKPLSEITRGDILDLFALLVRKYPDKLATINKVADYVASIFSEAYYREDLRNNPAMRLTDIKYEKKTRGTFTAEEIRALFSDPEKWASPLAYQVFLFAAYTGRRAGEILGLQWEQIKDGYCTIDRAYNRAVRGLASPKWDKCVTFPICKTLLERLPEKGDCPYVFNSNGERLCETWWNTAFWREMTRLGVAWKERNLVPHSFRHSLNNNLLLAGVNRLFVRRYIGWSEGRDTQEVYTHIEPGHLKAVADKIDEIYKL